MPQAQKTLLLLLLQLLETRNVNQTHVFMFSVLCLCAMSGRSIGMNVLKLCIVCLCFVTLYVLHV